MTITQNDLEILATEVMADTPDGGGLPTAIPIVDGVSNNLFPDVSDLDAVNGRVRLRKVVLAVKTATSELLQAARFLITELPNNPNISVFAFQPTAFADRRAQARNKIESYLTYGQKWAGHLLELQLEGQRVIQLAMDNRDPSPKVGDGLVLIQNEGQSDEAYQYIRVQTVDNEVREFIVSDTGGQRRVTRKVVTIEISQPLKQNFNGLTVAESYNGTSTQRRAVVRASRVADAATYYSASRLSAPVTAMGTRQVRVESIYTQVVPSSTIPTALPLIDPVGRSTALVAGADGTIAISKSISINTSTPWYIGSAIYPSSMTLNVNGITMTDADGELKDGAGTLYGAVNYEMGRVDWYETANFGIKTVTGGFTPAGSLMRVMQSEIAYTPTTDVGTSYIRTLQTKPTNGSLQVSFQVSGEVSTIRDDGAGSLTDGDGNKYGIIDYDNKIVQLVLPAIPDAQSAIIYTYSTDLGTTKVGGTTSNAYFVFNVNGYIPPSATITWSGKTATIANGLITGDATGTFDGSQLRLIPNQIPAVGTKFTISYNKPVDDTQIINGTTDVAGIDNSFSFNVGKVDAGKFNGTMRITGGKWKYFSEDKANLSQWLLGIKDDGAGNIVLIKSYGIASSSGIATATRNLTMGVTGTINYATGDVVVNFDASAELIEIDTKIVDDPAFAYFSAWRIKKTEFTERYTAVTANATDALFEYTATKDLTSTESKTFEWTASELNLTIPAPTNAPIVSGSVSLLGATDAAGVMTRDGVAVGSVDYQSGEVVLTNWTATANPVAITSAVREYAVPTLTALVFRTPSAPIQPNTLTVNITANGTAYQATADADGMISVSYTADYDGSMKTGISGFIEYQTGVIALYGVNIDPESVSYTAMAVSYMPLDAEQIGLDPVRLPLDGRVRFIRKGDTVAITELKTMALPTNAAGDSFDLGSERLSDVAIYDNEGVKVSYDALNIDLDAGIAAFDSSFVASVYTAPFTAKYRIMDLGKVNAVDISGRVTLSNTITHDYTTNAVLSSMLIAGDMQSRVNNVFSQKTWTSKWSNELIGDRAESQLQTASAPIVVTNNDTITERWALIFVSATSFRIVGETVGEIATGSTSSATAPINLMTGQPYFTIPSAAWGSGWDAGNVVRFNTVAAAYPVWVGNAIQQHQLSRLDTYDFSVSYHANIDRERV